LTFYRTVINNTEVVKGGNIVNVYEKAYIVVLSTKKRFVDCNTFVAAGTLAFYLPEKDTDQDGFPDNLEDHDYCFPIQLTGKRLGIIEPCQELPEFPNP